MHICRQDSFLCHMLVAKGNSTYSYLNMNAFVEFDLLVHAAAVTPAVVAVCRTLTSLVVTLLVTGVGHTFAPLAATTFASVVQFSVNCGRILAAGATGVKPTGRLVQNYITSCFSTKLNFQLVCLYHTQLIAVAS